MEIGKSLNSEKSIFYWCQKNQIPVMCPALLDSEFGNIFYNRYKNNKKMITIDLAHDITEMNRFTLH